MLDVFNTDAFSVVSMTAAIDQLPLTAGRLGQTGWFKEKGITTTTALIENRNGVLSLLQTAPRGAAGSALPNRSRHARSLIVPHIPHDSAVLASEVQDIRAFGSEDQLESVAQIVNDRLGEMKANHEMTWEHHRMGALQGIILDADGSTLFNLFTEFGVSQTTLNIDFTSAATALIGAKANAVYRTLRDKLGGTPFTHLHAFCGDNFFDALVDNDDVKDSYARWRDGEFLRTRHVDEGNFFEWGGIRWENYQGSVGSTNFINTEHAYVVPVGVPDLFQRINAPGNFVEAANTIGKPLYAKQERMKFDVGVEIHTESNPLHICNRPACIHRLVKTN